MAMHAAELYQQALVQAEAVRSSGTVEQFAFADVSATLLGLFLTFFLSLHAQPREEDSPKSPRYPLPLATATINRT